MAPTSTSPVLMPTRRCTPSWVSLIVRCMTSAALTARSASSSWAIGAPNRAMMASPTILSTRPPNSVTTATSRWKQRSTRYFTCSGSRDSLSDVKPTMSAKTTVTTRRSSPRAVSTWPQEGQKRAPSGTDARRAGQVTTGQGYARLDRYGPLGVGMVHEKTLSAHDGGRTVSGSGRIGLRGEGECCRDRAGGLDQVPERQDREADHGGRCGGQDDQRERRRRLRRPQGEVGSRRRRARG